MSVNKSLASDTSEQFICPADPIHKLNTYERYKRHVNKCKAIRNKKIFFCRFFWAHQYLNQQHKNNHEIICDSNPIPGVELPPIENDFFIIKNDDTIAEDCSMLGKYRPDQIDWWEKHKHEVLAYKRRKDIVKRRVEIEKCEMDRPIKQLEDLQVELSRKLDSITQSKNIEDYIFNFKGPDFDHFQMILIEKGLYKFKTNWFDLEEYSLVSNFDEFFKEEISEEIFRIYLGGEFVLSDNATHFLKNLETLLAVLSQKNVVAINYSKGCENNTQECLIVISKDTEFFGKFLNKTSHLGVIVLPRRSFKSLALERKDFFKEESCWLFLEEAEEGIGDGDGEEHNEIIEERIVTSEEKEIDQARYEKIMRKYILRHEAKNLEKSLKEKEHSYEIYLVEKKEELKYLVNQLNDLKKRKDNFEEDLKKLNDRNNIIKKDKQELINKNKEKYKAKIDEEKKNLNKRFNELKRKLDEENLDISNYYKEHDGNMKELQDEHQKIDERLELIYKKKKEFAEMFDNLEEGNIKMIDAIRKLENDFEEKHFFEKIIEINNKTNKETVCLICAEKRREIVNMPCKHITMCSECYLRVTSPLNFRVCFICNRFIERTIKAIVENI